MIFDFIFRWLHVLFGVVWIGMLYYFNFVQTEYFKEAEASAKADAVKKLAPRALWWFRWGAMFTFLTGLVLLHLTGATTNIMGNPVIWIGALAGTIMFLNVWLVIWPNQQVVLGQGMLAVTLALFVVGAARVFVGTPMQDARRSEPSYAEANS